MINSGTTPVPPFRTVHTATATTCADVRQHVTAAAGRAGLDADQAARFTLAVNEVMINAVQHGGGSAAVTITSADHRVTVEVSDHGPGIRVPVTVQLPPVDALHGRGLWLVRQLCQDVTFTSSDAGLSVRLSAISG